MPRTKGSKNKKLITKVLKPLSNFESMKVEMTKTQIYHIGFSKKDIELLINMKARELCNHKMTEFEAENVIYDKKGNAFVTLSNPIERVKIKDEKSTDTSTQK